MYNLGGRNCWNHGPNWKKKLKFDCELGVQLNKANTNQKKMALNFKADI